jgi:hypothetical protein
MKLPKSLGACVDLYHDMREKRLAEDKKVKAMKVEEQEICEHLINNISKKDEGGAVGKRFKAIVKNEDAYTVEDWDKFYAHIKKTGQFDLLNRALNQAAVKERVEEQRPARPKPGWKPKLPPGVGTFNVTKLSVTKI